MAFLNPDGLMRGTHDWTPKLSNRFFFSFEEDPTTKLLCRASSRPSLSFNEVRIPHPNKTRYEQGKPELDPLNVTLMDYVTPSSAQFVEEWIKSHAEMYTGRQGYSAFYRRSCTLEVFGPTGDVVERWDYLNCKINTVDFGALDFDNDEPVQITMTIRYDDYILRF